MSNVCESFFNFTRKAPDKIALIFGDKKISYRELGSYSNQIAQALLQAKVTPKSLVGIHLTRSPHLISTIMAILKIGAGYVPLDISYPKERLGYILENSNINFVITEKSIENDIFVAENLKLVYVEDLIKHQPNEKDCKITSGEVVYVIYTSGSTGLPKGVVMGHRALGNLINWQKKTSKASDGITLQYSPISFDVSFQEIFSTLSFGGTLVLCSEETRRDPKSLLNLIITKEISRIFLPFVSLQQLSEIAKEGNFSFKLREVITAGEQLKITPNIRSFFQLHPDCKLINQYGPTETHVVTAYELCENPQKWQLLPPIGTPILNVSVYVLDSSLKEVKRTNVGELYIGGVCLSEGYLNNPDFTHSRFVQHPLTNERIYRTGDLVRRLDDGNLKFLGRVDQQVKIRGYRVEVGEVEAILGEHPDIQECIIDVGKDVMGNNRLIAYIVVRQKYNQVYLKPSTQNHLKWHLFLKKKLPDYMIPSTYIVVSSFPLTPTGKIDRKSLLKLSNYKLTTNSFLISPKSKVEEKIANIWKEALQLDELGIDDNFFELGGNSLLITFVRQKISELLMPDVNIIDLFQYPTIRLLAEYMKKNKKKIKSVSSNNITLKKAGNSIALRRINIRRHYER